MRWIAFPSVLGLRKGVRGSQGTKSRDAPRWVSGGTGVPKGSMGSPTGNTLGEGLRQSISSMERNI